MTIVLIAVLLYLAASALLVRALGRDETTGSPIWLWPALPAMLLHGGYHVMVAMRTNGGPDMHFFAALSLVGLGMAWLTSLVGARGRMSALGVVVFPLAAV
ncbi:inner membrane protein YpjD, partial [Xanthomonas vesicatoria]|nr:inner membrane protein YpjD [Xanthomonas vesicatoria]